jgi:hypothetical protein
MRIRRAGWDHSSRGNRIIAYHCEGGFRGRASCWRLRRPWLLETDETGDVRARESGAGLDPNPSSTCGFRGNDSQEQVMRPGRSRATGRIRCILDDVDDDVLLHN